MAFQAECSVIAGQTLPVSSRSRANTKLNAVAMITKSRAVRKGGEPTRNAPPRTSGTCQRPQIRPRRWNGFGQPSVNEAREHVTTPADLFTGRRESAVGGSDSGRDGKVNHEHDARGSCVRDVRRRQHYGARAELYQARRPRDTVSN